MSNSENANESAESARNDYDGPWKDILESCFEECMAFFFSDVHSAIDWEKGYDFLDKELQQVTREAEIGKRIADKLVKVWTIAGEQVWVLVHIEIQGQAERQFEDRMYTYNYRLYDQFKRPVASFAILSDSSPSWRPSQFSTDLWGCSIDFKFRTAKLLDYKSQWENLLVSSNPFAMVVMAHLKAIETSGNNTSRKDGKLSLIKMLYQRGYSRDNIVKLLNFIDWLIALPPTLESNLWREIRIYQEKLKMRYIPSYERIAKEEAKQEGREEGREEGKLSVLRKSIKLILEVNFGEEASLSSPNIDSITDIAKLERLQERLVRKQLTLNELAELCR